MSDLAASILKEILDSIDASYTGIELSEVAGQTILSIKTGDGRTLIGMHGDTVHALDHLVKKITEKRTAPSTDSAQDEGERLMFLVDVNDYRAKQIKDLQTKALMMAERARSFQYDVELTPMSAYERLIIHTALQDSPNVKTESQGEGRNRRVVIKYSTE